jgi:hypothetical protein
MAPVGEAMPAVTSVWDTAAAMAPVPAPLGVP